MNILTNPLEECHQIRLISMDDKFSKLKEGDEGTCMGVDGIGNILMKWNDGSTLNLIPGIDHYTVLH